MYAVLVSITSITPLPLRVMPSIVCDGMVNELPEILAFTTNEEPNRPKLVKLIWFTMAEAAAIVVV